MRTRTTRARGDAAREESSQNTIGKQIPKPKAPSRILIVDDHPIFREGLAGAIGQAGGLTTCGQADNAPAALAAVESLEPDLVLVDLNLPGRSGLELIKDIRAVRPQTAVLVISMHDEAMYAERVLRAGGQGYIMKQEGPAKMLEAIRTVLGGQLYLSSKMSSRMLSVLSGRHPEAKSALSQLTDRQLEILQLTGAGLDSHAIANQLHLSFKTVDAHRAQIKVRLELKNYTELISYAARWVETRGAPRVKKPGAVSGKSRGSSGRLG